MRESLKTSDCRGSRCSNPKRPIDQIWNLGVVGYLVTRRYNFLSLRETTRTRHRTRKQITKNQSCFPRKKPKFKKHLLPTKGLMTHFFQAQNLKERRTCSACLDLPNKKAFSTSPSPEFFLIACATLPSPIPDRFSAANAFCHNACLYRVMLTGGYFSAAYMSFRLFPALLAPLFSC